MAAGLSSLPPPFLALLTPSSTLRPPSTHLPLPFSPSTQLKENLLDADDPLDPFCRYVRWLQETHPQGQSSQSNLVNTLERATRAFKDDSRYKNDPRYLRLWLAYAECVDEPRDIFLYLEAQGIGMELALFYEEFSLLWESYGRYILCSVGTLISRDRLDKADAVYRQGRERQAKPFDRLQRRYAEFQRRCSANADKMVPSAPSTANSSRRVLTDSSSNAAVGSQMAPSVRSDGPRMETIKVFQEDKPSAEHVVGSWRDIGTTKTRDKENEQRAEKWTGSTLLQRPGVSTAKPIEKVPVFQEEALVGIFTMRDRRIDY